VPWIAFYVGIAVAGLAVLAVVSVRLWRQVRQLGIEVAAASRKVAALSDELSQISPPNR
jgi:hypothetical protein